MLKFLLLRCNIMVEKETTKDILVPLQQPEDENLTPYPEIEYKIVE
jgi:hypothetical protein